MICHKFKKNTHASNYREMPTLPVFIDIQYTNHVQGFVMNIDFGNTFEEAFQSFYWWFIWQNINLYIGVFFLKICD